MSSSDSGGAGSRGSEVSLPGSTGSLSHSGSGADSGNLQGRASFGGMKFREARRRITIPAQVRKRPEGPLHNATVRNASSHGLMISGAGLPPTGAVVEVVRGSLVLTGRVVWSVPDRCGIHVAQGYDPEALVRGYRVRGTGEGPSCAHSGGDDPNAVTMPDCEHAFDRMLDELKHVHEQLLAAMADLKTLLARDRPDREQLADIRLKLMRASRKRLQAVDIIYASIVRTISTADREQLQQLSAEGLALRTASAKHVATWSLEKAVEDWGGYGEASTAVRASMRRRIMREKQVIYPILEALS